MYRGDEALHAAVLLSNEHGKQDATVVFPYPDRNLYWFIARDVELPSSPPTRIELAGMLLDRRSLLPVSYRALGEAPAIGARGTFALYDGSVGDAAIVMTGDVTLVWHGQRLAPDDYDNLGKAD